jgi:hypothetical protein
MVAVTGMLVAGNFWQKKSESYDTVIENEITESDE